MGLFVDQQTIKAKVSRNDPWKVAVIDITPDATEVEVEKAVTEACHRRKISVSKVELFQDRVNDRKRTSAFVSLSCKEDLDAILDDSVKTFGVYIRGQRSSLLEVDEKRTISIRGKKPILEEDVNAILETFKVPSKGVDVFLARDRAGNPVGSTFVTFNNHQHAYITWKSIKDLNDPNFDSQWSQRDFTAFSKIAKTSEILHNENESLREQLENMAAQQAALLAKIAEKTGDPSIKNSDFTFSHFAYTHIMKVLEVTNFDRKQAQILLQLPGHKFNRLIRDLRERGYNVETKETRGKAMKTKL